MSLHKLTWQKFDIHNLSRETKLRLKHIYTRFISNGVIENYIQKMFNNISIELTFLLELLTSKRNELFQIENFNVDKGIEYFSNVLDKIKDEDYESLDLYELMAIPMVIEMVFDESGLLDLLKEENE